MLNDCQATHTVAIASPRKIISCAVLFYYRFAVSFRHVEEAMASRGIVISYETVRQCEKE